MTTTTTDEAMAHAVPIEYYEDHDHVDLPTVAVQAEDCEQEILPLAEDFSDPCFDDAIEALITSGPLTSATQVLLEEPQQRASEPPTALHRHDHYATVRAEYISASFFRTDNDWSLGLKLNKSRIIVSIAPNSPAAHSPLQVGDKLISINQQVLSDWSHVHHALQAPGTIHLVVHNQGGASDVVECLITKDQPKIGIAIKKDRTKQILTIKSINPHLAAAQSLLNPEDQLLSINQIPATQLTLLEAVQCISSSNAVSIKVITSHSTGVVLGEQDQSFVEEPVIPQPKKKLTGWFQQAFSQQQQQQQQQSQTHCSPERRQRLDSFRQTSSQFLQATY